MSELSVNFSKIDDVIDDLAAIEGYFDDRMSTVGGAKRTVGGITNEFGYLSSATSSLQSKVDQLQGYKDDITSFKNNLSAFREFADTEETGLANRIYSDTNDFMHDNGITPEYEKSTLEKLWEGACDFVSNIATAVVDFVCAVGEWVVENWETIKQVFIVIGEILIAVAAIVVFVLTFPVSSVLGAIVMVGAGWAAVKAVTTLTADAIALGYFIGGDKEKAREMADKELHDFVDEGAEWLNEKTGWDHWDEIADGAYFALDVCEFVGDILNPAETPAVLEWMDAGGNFMVDVWDKGAFALTDLMGVGDDPTIMDHFSDAVDLIDDDSEFLTEALREEGIISETTENRINMGIDMFGDAKDIVKDTMDFSEGIESWTSNENLTTFLMMEGMMHENATNLQELIDNY